VERRPVEVKGQGRQEIPYFTTPEGSNLLDIFKGAGSFLITLEPVPNDTAMLRTLPTVNDTAIFYSDLIEKDQEGCDYYGAIRSPESGP